MTKVYIAQSAWETIINEVRYFASRGNLEAIVYPLFGFVRNSECVKAPWEMLEVEDIDSFVITHAHAPLRKYCQHTGVRAKYVFSTIEEEEDWFDDLSSWYNPICSEYLSLEIGNVHSHPFSFFWTFPSSGSQMDYPRIYRLWEHMKSRKVNTPLEIILCRSNIFGNKWSACCFVFDKNQKIVTLQKAQIIPDNDNLVKAVLSKPYYLTEEGKRWEQEQLASNNEIEAFDKYHFGWSTVRVKVSETKYLFFHLPPQFPNIMNILVQSYDKSESCWSEMKRHLIRGSFVELKTIIKAYQ